MENKEAKNLFWRLNEHPRDIKLISDVKSAQYTPYLVKICKDVLMLSIFNL